MMLGSAVIPQQDECVPLHHPVIVGTMEETGEGFASPNCSSEKAVSENIAVEEAIVPDQEEIQPPSVKRFHEGEQEDEKRVKLAKFSDDSDYLPLTDDPITVAEYQKKEEVEIKKEEVPAEDTEKNSNDNKEHANEHVEATQEPHVDEPSEEEKEEPALNIHEKLKDMDEISVKPVSKTETVSSRWKDNDSEVSLEIKKKIPETEDAKKITNLRKNIREVMDENQLDAVTLAAQRQESERLARVQEQQKIIRELQRQMAAERQNNRTQSRVLSLLQGQTSLLKSSFHSSTNDRSAIPGSSSDMYVVKGVASEVTLKGSNFVDLEKISSGCLTPSVSIAPLRRMKPSEEEADVDEDKKEVVTIVDSSSEDDCIVLSDDDEDIEEESEDDPHNSGLHVKDAYNIPDEQGRVVINIGHPEGESDIFVAPQVARIIKPHQIGGVRFLYDNIIESTERFNTSSGFGCILAHSMGLGKTLQVVCFCDIFLRHTNSKSILCIMPINTLQNWVAEFNMWVPEDPEKSPLRAHGEVRPRNFKVFVLNEQYKTLSARSKVILEWARQGGVLLMGYELYRLLALKLVNKKKKGKKALQEKEGKSETEAHKKLMEDIHGALVRPGADLIICDEGHRIKNSHASISVALKQIRSKRRIVLTGYPLQNNLLEYWCMVDFVRPNYLGTRTEFSNMFERPIQNGQCIDSTPQDIKLMRYRAHVLHSLLVGFVQRRSHVVLQNSLPPKEEYVILVRMTQFQRQLYDVFMNEVVRVKAVPNPLKAFAVCCKIWNHPDVLYNFLKKREADLDIELEEADGESGTNAALNAKNKKKGTIKPAQEVSKDGKTIPAAEISPNRSKKKLGCVPEGETKVDKIEPSSEEQSTKSHPESQLLSSNDSYDRSCSSFSSYSNDKSYYGQYNNFYPPNQFRNQVYDPAYMAQNQFWQCGPGYYDYNAGNDPYEQGDPSYTGMIPKATESFEHTKLSFDEKNSSEIVDLDTKEIKTVEARINTLEIKDTKPIISLTKQEPGDEIVPNTIEKEVIKTKDDGIPYDWAVELMKGYMPDLLENSPKMVIFFRLLEESLRLGDRILVFSQSLLTLNLIERFLQKSKVPGFDFNWMKNSSYFRLDGSTTAIEREKLVNEFNANPQIHLFLVSTRAGSLGINLVGANRVIVFDASWNPCHDTQAVCRVYRYGQKKPCFVYRIVMDNCLEKKIYDRQVNKQGMSDRVVDECNPDAHLSMKEVTNLCYDNEEETEVKDFSDCKDKYLDVVMQKIVEIHSDLLSKEPFHHESLLVDRKEKKLSQAEKRLAQRGYEMEKRASAKPTYMYHPVGTQYRVMRTSDGSLVHRPVASVRPMQADTGEKQQMTRPGGVRPTRWIPAEVWQRQGMTAQEMTLPLDVVIPTSSGDKANIVLKAGQKVMVLKSPKGIYMQLESGKIIAIRTSFKMGHNKDKSDDADINFTKTDESKVPNQRNELTSETKKLPPLFGSKHKHTEQGLESKSSGRSFSSSFSHSKSFNMQNFIDSKTTPIKIQPKEGSNNDDVIMVADGNASEAFNMRTNHSHSKNPFHRNSFGYNQNSKHPPFSRASNSPMANIKPQFHENKWEQQKSKIPTQTITIDDDAEHPAREKTIISKSNLSDKKTKISLQKINPSVQQTMTKPNAVAFVGNKTKLNPGSNPVENLRQMHNVKPYNRQFGEQKPPPEPRSGNRSKLDVSPVKLEGKQKMPNIKNIPAPYPSVCASQGQQVNPVPKPIYSQPAHTSISTDMKQESSFAENLSQTMTASTSSQKQRERVRQTSPKTRDNDLSTSGEDSRVPPVSQENNTPAEKTPTENTTYNRYDQPSAVQFSAVQSDSSFNYLPPDPSNYSQQYSSMYVAPNSHPYGYSSQYPNPQQGYSYATYSPYDSSMYGTTTPASSVAYPSVQPAQYSYPNYPPPPTHPTPDQYNSYYNYPPYPPPANQWQQQ